MKILFYGACHVGALARILTTYGEAGTVQTQVIQNYALMQKGLPFPVKTLREYDAFVFNPLFTKSNYHTDQLVDACRGFGVQTVSLPLMEWRGYFPGLSKGVFGAKSNWYYPSLYEIALRFDTFAAFEAFVVEEHSPPNIEAHLATSNTVAARTEELGHADICVAGFIAEHFADQRLFLTPGHPARPLYQYVIKELTRQLSLKIDPSYYWNSYEPQAGFVDPILPGASRALGLKFREAEFLRSDVFGSQRVLSLREYLTIYYHVARHATVFEATNRTRLKNGPQTTEEGAGQLAYAFEKGDLLIGLPDPAVRMGNLGLTVLTCSRHPVLQGARWHLHNTHWKRHEFHVKAAVEKVPAPISPT